MESEEDTQGISLPFFDRKAHTEVQALHFKLSISNAFSVQEGNKYIEVTTNSGDSV